MSQGRLLILGAGGQVGRALIEAAAAAGIEAAGATRHEVDIADASSVRRAVARYAPSVVINAAAYTAVDRAESEPDLAFAVNRDGPANLAKACAGVGAALVHLSTDYVFDGTKAGPYVEEDVPNPAGVYGRSKLAGEEAVRAELPDRHLLVRTAWVFSAHGHNFLRTMWRLAGEREELRVVVDQVGCPTPADALAADVLLMAGRLAASACEPGVYHWAGRPAVSWHGFAEAILDEARRHGPLAARRVERITTADYPTAAPRPANSVLDMSKAESMFEITPPSWRDGLSRAVAVLAASR